ncbi:UvrD-helicase domain-containing protein [Methylobacter tundripaludum]|uniref:UvrD-helicase domain-containing protein n=1 Tax=Methylobacter tundripaludum TaxID=173365 RepID=UPI000AAEBBF7|nr:UvrD-helicase domain-containing protein [Methylobacter tundripaludum]
MKTIKTLSYRVSWLASLFASDYQSLSLAEDGIVLAGRESVRIPYLEISFGTTVEQGFFWNALLIPLENGHKLRFNGVAKKKSESLQETINHQCRNHIKAYYQRIVPDLQQAHQQARVSFSGYIRHAAAQQWFTNHQHLAKGIERQDIDDFLPPESQRYVKALKPLFTQGYIDKRNKAYVRQQLATFQSFFDQVESNPLTANQRKACVIDEQHNLVLAGAGTGKTSTMIGRAGYLIKAGIAPPEKILMLAFARKAAEEMDQRIQSQLGIDNLTAKTFHSLGKHIIAQVEGVAPSIDKMAEDERLRTRFVDEQIQRLLEDELYKSRLVTYFLRFSHPYKSAFNFKSLGEYNNYILENDIRTLQGELVKSYEECEIANCLFRQGIVYEYEANYQINTAGPDYRAYQPDFYLPEYGIYIEHFAINEKGQTPPFIDQQSYLSGMAWKRELHQKHQTYLIETYSYLKQQGILTKSLEEKLLQTGVKFKPLANTELLKKLNEFGRVSEFSQLLSQVLALFKAACLDLKSLVSLAKQHEDHERMQAAAFLFEPIYEVYQQHLRDTATIDFEDMIGKAIEYVEEGRYQSPYRHLLVDEFQDISASRARLVKALLAQNPDNSLFCVGDDWQSIYRFTGSDVSITKEFEEHFGYTAVSVLDKTFRFNNKIGDVASRFVMQNSTQIAKKIQSHNIIEQAAVSLIMTNQDQVGLNAALSAINAKANENVTVLILARFNFRKPDLSAFKRQYPKLRLQFMSVHGSKGKEADYVIVLGMEKGKHGFPSEKATHPLLDLLLPKAESFAHAEERRLFYVALTRARQHVYLVSDANKASDFVRELIDKNYEILCDEFTGEKFQKKMADVVCSECETGYLVPRDSQYGSFLGCSQYPLCNHTESACQWCGGALKGKGRFRVCENKRCDYVEPVCPKCNGKMSIRKGPSGQFWGCSHYRRGAEFSCSHTEKFIDLKNR